MHSREGLLGQYQTGFSHALFLGTTDSSDVGIWGMKGKCFFQVSFWGQENNATRKTWEFLVYGKWIFFASGSAPRIEFKTW